MPSAVRSPIILPVFVLLLTRFAFAATCSSTFIAIPSAILGASVYLTTVDSADAICKHNGFSKAGSIRTSTLHIMGLSMSAIRVSNLEILSARSTLILTAVECLKPGQKACLADSNGNIGSDNKGKNNFGTKNTGSDNIGNSNAGNANWGNNNNGMGNRCFNKTGITKVINNCNLLEFRKYAWVLSFPPPPVKKSPPPPAKKSPPPPAKKSPPPPVKKSPPPPEVSATTLQDASSAPIQEVSASTHFLSSAQPLSSTEPSSLTPPTTSTEPSSLATSTTSTEPSSLTTSPKPSSLATPPTSPKPSSLATPPTSTKPPTSTATGTHDCHT
ncbi:hypothetical protein ACKKBF_B40670 [Auxenochlorella protothecoides x Auxenochlorella symbiontica]